jgi:hypothetical protein
MPVAGGKRADKGRVNRARIRTRRREPAFAAPEQAPAAQETPPPDAKACREMKMSRLARNDRDAKRPPSAPLTAAIGLLALTMPFGAPAGIPATPVMTLYEFNGDLRVPYYSTDDFARRGAGSPSGYLTQGSSVIPCLVIRDGRPLTDGGGTPYVGFEVVVDAAAAGPDATDRFKRAVTERKALRVENHHCRPGIDRVINVRKLYALNKAPFFDPPSAGRAGPGGRSELDRIVQDFHGSRYCERANRSLVGRRDALAGAWDRYIAEHKGRTPEQTLARAKHLDYTMRTALFEGHLDRGCNAYGACERNIIALSIRNRARGQCLKRQGCRFPGDFQGVASDVSQYNIWDELLTQISGLTSCYLRRDLGSPSNRRSGDYYDKLQAMHEQNVADVERILYGSDAEITELFPRNSLQDLSGLRHYYHAPAMGKCFPDHRRVEYMSGAVARKGDDHALIANTRIEVGDKVGSGYRFKEFLFTEAEDRDLIDIEDNYPGFVVDARKVRLKGSAGCLPYGVPRGCGFKSVGRYRKAPFWLDAGKPLELSCRIRDLGEACQSAGSLKTASVGGSCDTQMRPVAHVR